MKKFRLPFWGLFFAVSFMSSALFGCSAESETRTDFDYDRIIGISFNNMHMERDRCWCFSIDKKDSGFFMYGRFFDSAEIRLNLVKDLLKNMILTP